MEERIMAETQGGDDFVTLAVEMTAEQIAPLKAAANVCGLTLEAFVLAAACDAAVKTLAG
jgi:uncharacterized protein (DUF1778 family)